MQLKKILTSLLAGSLMTVNLITVPAFAAGNPLTVNVSGGSGAVPGAKVTIGDTIHTTDTDGNAVFDGLDTGSAKISIVGGTSKYMAQELTVEVDGSEQTVNVTLDEKAEDAAPAVTWQDGSGTGLRSLGIQAFLLEDGREAPKAGAHRDAKVFGTSDKEKLLRTVLYFGAGGPGFRDEATEQTLKAQQRLIAKVWAGSASEEETAPFYRAEGEEKVLKTAPSSFVPYIYGSEDVTRSAAVSWAPKKYGDQTVTVASTNPEWTNGMDCYTLEGAVVKAGGSYAVTDAKGEASLGAGQAEIVCAPEGYNMPESTAPDVNGQIALSPKKANLSPLCWIAGTDAEGEYEVKWYKEKTEDFSIKSAGTPDMSWIIRSQKAEELPEQFIGAAASSAPAAAAAPAASAAASPASVTNPDPVSAVKPAATVTVGEGNLKIEAPREVRQGDSITIKISSASDGASGKIAFEGLEITGGVDNAFTYAKSFVLVLGSEAVYECRVTAKPGETVSATVSNVQEMGDTDVTYDVQEGKGAEWSVKVAETAAAPTKTTATKSSVAVVQPSASAAPSVSAVRDGEAVTVPSLPTRVRKVSLYDKSDPPTHMLTFDGLVSGDPVPEGGLPYGTLVISSVREPMGSAAEKTPLILSLNENSQYTYGVLHHEMLMSGASVTIETEDGEEPEGLATLAGAKFEIIPKENQDVLAATITTDEDGVAETRSEVLPYGDYTLRMIEAPEGYELPENTEIPFTVTSSSAVTVGPLAVTSIRAALTGKRVSDDTGEPVSGVPFRVTSETNGNIYTAVTGVDGRFTTAQLPYDNYLVEELSGASNRTLEKATFRVAVRESGMIDLGTITKNGPEALDSKYVPDTAAPLQTPAPSQAADPALSQSTPVPTGGAAAPISTLAPGATATVAPGGVQTPAPGASQTAAGTQATQTPVPQPAGAAAKTDDGSNAAGWLTLLGAAAAAMIGMIFHRKKKGTMVG